MSVNWRYWRLVIDTPQNGANPFLGVEYFAVTATIGGANIFTGGTASASSTYSGYAASDAFVDDAVVWFCANGGIPASLQYDRGSGNSTTGRFLYVRGYRSSLGYSPKIMRLQGSADGSTGWTSLVEVDITGYTLADRWVIDSIGTLCIPFGYVVSGNSTHTDTTEVQRVFINDWTTGVLVDSVVPDSAGDWESIFTGPSDVLVTHIGDSGYRPLADGPVTPANR